jgi:hypothetical protein
MLSLSFDKLRMSGSLHRVFSGSRQGGVTLNEVFRNTPANPYSSGNKL